MNSMLPGTLARTPVRFGAAYMQRFLRWAEPLNVSTRVQAELGSFLTWVALLTIGAIAVSTVKVTIRLQVQDLRIRMSASRALQGRLLDEQDRLSRRYAELSNVSTIESISTSRLGMLPVAPGQELVMR